MKIKNRHRAIESLEKRIQFTALPDGFAETLIATNLVDPTAIDILPDGRILVARQSGTLAVIKDGTVLSSPALHIDVDNTGERGLLGIAHDPAFDTNHYVYVYHTVAGVNGAAPFNMVSRYTLNGDVAVAGSGVDILRLNDLSTATNHNGGALHFGLDGKLYIGVGENADPPNSQTLSTLLGKILRIDVSTVAPGDPVNNVAKLIPSDNPFVGQAVGINQAIFALGFRNPFTFAVHPTNGKIYINDVGLLTWEEIDDLQAGGNYGWSKSEGFATTVPPADLGPGTYHDPVLAYNHTGGPAGGGIAIVGGAFYSPPVGAAHPFPSEFNGKYFYGDLGNRFIRVFDPNNPGSLANPDPSAAFATSTTVDPVGMALLPDGSLLYFTRFSVGEIYKISYTGAQTPTISSPPASTLRTVGDPATFSVKASGPGTLSYQWQRNTGVGGAFEDISGATASTFVFNSVSLTDDQSLFRVVVTNAFGSATSDPATLSVTTNHAPAPFILITAGLRNGKFDAGTPISFSLAASDVEDGTVPVSGFSYRVDYITSVDSVGGIVRPFAPDSAGVSQATFTPAATGPYTAADVKYRISFTATDSQGFAATSQLDINPNTSIITLNTTPAGMNVNVDGQLYTSPVSLVSVVGFHRLLDAPKAQNFGGSYEAFDSWSDGGASQHFITTPESDSQFTATYQLGSVLTFDRKHPARFTDADGTPVTVRLEGKGSGTMVFSGQQVDASAIILSNTTKGSILRIVTKGRGASTSVGDITSANSMFAVVGATTDITGDLHASGTLAILSLRNAVAGSAIEVLGTGIETNVRLKSADGLSLSVAGKIGSLFVPGVVTHSTLRAGGNIRSAIVGSMINSNLFAGVDSSVVTLPTAAGDFVANALIGQFITRGNKGVPFAFAGSNVAAARIGNVLVRHIGTDNAGKPFGFASLAGKLAAFTRHESNIKDFRWNRKQSAIRLTFEGDLVVRLI